MALDLVTYLANLNSAETNLGIWVNPQNINEYRQGQIKYENGGLQDNWVFIGTLDALSFGFQSFEDALKEFVTDCNGEFYCDGEVVTMCPEDVLRAYREDILDSDFKEWLEQKVQIQMQQEALAEAQFFVDNALPMILEVATLDYR